MKPTQPSQPLATERKPYQPPAIVYDAPLEAQAGTPVPGPDPLGGLGLFGK